MTTSGVPEPLLPIRGRTIIVRKEAVVQLRDLVNSMVSKPMMDKHQPGITGMDAKYILREIAPLLGVDVTNDGLRVAVNILNRYRDRPPDIESLEDYCEFLLGLVTSALSALQFFVVIDKENPTSE